MSSTQRTDRLAFDRADRLGLTILLWVVAALVSLGGIVLPLALWVTGRSVPVPFTSEVDVPELDRVGTAYGPAQYDVEITDLSALDRLLTFLPGLVLVALVVAGALIMQRIARDVGRGTPFVSGQVRRLRILALLLVVGAPVLQVVELVTTSALLSGADLGGLPASVWFDFPIGPMLLGLFLALLAEAFRHGDRLEDDLEGVI